MQSIEDLGGLEKYISKGDKVLLKINLLMKKPPEAATTSNPVFVQALAEILMTYGANVIIGDSPGGPFSERALKGIYETCGITQAAKNCGAELNYNTNTAEVSFPDGFLLKKLTVVDMLSHVDKVISVSRLKTHCMAKMTGAVKNMFGIIPGTMKAEYHMNRSDVSMFAESLVDICMYANPVLSFMDAIVAMEGDGPSSGTPRAVGAVLSSANPYCLDVVAASLINVDPMTIPTISASSKRNLSPTSVEALEIVGDGYKKFVVKDFKAPAIRSINPLNGKVPKFLNGFLNNNLQPRPVFVHTKCIGCRDCFNACPPKAISMVEKLPVVDLDKCIRCFCCQELCPEKAIDVKRPFLFNIITKL